MTLPTTLRIDGASWAIKRRSGLRCEGETVLGYCNYRTKTLWVRRGMSAQETLRTLLHEVLHAALPDTNEEAVQRAEGAVDNLLRSIGKG